MVSFNFIETEKLKMRRQMNMFQMKGQESNTEKATDEMEINNLPDNVLKC